MQPRLKVKPSMLLIRLLMTMTTMTATTTTMMMIMLMMMKRSNRLWQTRRAVSPPVSVAAVGRGPWAPRRSAASARTALERRKIHEAAREREGETELRCATTRWLQTHCSCYEPRSSLWNTAHCVTATDNANEAIDDSRLCPGVHISGVTWWVVVNNSLRRCKPVSVFGPLCENMTSSTKPEVHNLLHCRQSRTKPRL